jgi:hypothetical protein
MPTGYTYAVQDGTVTELKDYALACARNFSALITMRDDPADAPIPDEFKPSDYHLNELKEAQKRLVQLQAMTVDQCEVAARAAGDESHRDWQRHLLSAHDARERYTAMLTKVKAWEPPTKDHVALKEFMISQLVDSIGYDCDVTYLGAGPVRKRRDDWHSYELKKAKESVDYHKEEYEAEVERCKNRTEWVRTLRESL